ncbi:Hypothetical protein GSB_150823 [Giardia duodenalis]|uniref:High cysteine protein n=2 Tax=Giardia intestinalis TaxID=5741 RepID=C6LX37_GIAIB|nr:High cysteine protein [Giardia intestinalis ATCC 50581]ESU45682.1 Hypothetical protein GSB_150823 [Giardia intestinalis]
MSDFDSNFDSMFNLSKGLIITFSVVFVLIAVGSIATCITLPIVLCGLCPCCHCCECCKRRVGVRYKSEVELA